MNVLKTVLLLSAILLLSACQNGITDTYWRLEDIAGKSVQLSDRAYLHLTDQDENRVDGFGGCNRFTGSFTASDGTIAFGPLIATRMACPDMQGETAFFAALHNVDGYRIEKDTLILLRHGEPLLRFRAARERP